MDHVASLAEVVLEILPRDAPRWLCTHRRLGDLDHLLVVIVASVAAAAAVGGGGRRAGAAGGTAHPVVVAHVGWGGCARRWGDKGGGTGQNLAERLVAAYSFREVRVTPRGGRAVQPSMRVKARDARRGSRDGPRSAGRASTGESNRARRAIAARNASCPAGSRSRAPRGICPRNVQDSLPTPMFEAARRAERRRKRAGTRAKRTR